jgi:hypothetical protein
MGRGNGGFSSSIMIHPLTRLRGDRLDFDEPRRID